MADRAICHCGEYFDDHGPMHNHAPVEMIADVMLTEEDVCGYCGAREDLADSKPAQDLGVFRGVRLLWCVDRGACQERVRGQLDRVAGVLDEVFERMQTPEARAAMERAFNATPEELGEAAVRAAQAKEES